MALSAAERETTIVWTDADERVMISSSQRKVITQLRKNPNFEEESSDICDGTEIVIGTLPLGAITVRKAVKTKRNGKKRNPRSGAARCGEMTLAGKPCQSIASKETGKCAKHS